MADKMDINKSCKVSNSSGKDVVVLDASSLVDNTTGSSPKQGYAQNLKPLPLKSENKSIPDGGSDSVALDDTYQDKQGKTQYSMLYQLLISERKSLFPVKDGVEMIDFHTWKYPDLSVSKTEADNMVKGYNFTQSLMAYPSSKLATDFTAATQKAQQAETPAAMLDVFKTYFNGTKGYKGLDFPSYLCASTFIRSFAWQWGLGDDGNPGRTYWLYAASDAGKQPTPHDRDSDSPNHGSVTFARNSDAPDPADPTDRNSAYTITYTSTDGTSKALFFRDGQLVDDLKSDLPGVCLQGGFGLKSQFTHNDADNSTPWPILVGTLGQSTKVLGVSQPPASWWQKNVTERTFSSWIDLFLKFMGVWMAFDFLKTKFQNKIDRLRNSETNENKGSEVTKEQQDQADQGSQEAAGNSRQGSQETANRMGTDAAPQVPDESGIPDSVTEVKTATVDTLQNIAADNYQGSIGEYGTQIESLGELGITEDLEAATTSLQDANTSLETARHTGEFSQVKTNMGDAKANIGEDIANKESTITEQLKKNLEESQKVIDEYNETAEKIEDDTNDVNDGEDPFEPEEAARG